MHSFNNNKKKHIKNDTQWHASKSIHYPKVSIILCKKYPLLYAVNVTPACSLQQLNPGEALHLSIPLKLNITIEQ